MKRMIFIMALMVSATLTYAGTIYDLSFNTIDGVKTNMSSFRGKKILVVILPGVKQDSSFSLSELTVLQGKYDSSLVVIGILSEELGYKKGDEGKVKQLYKDKHRNLIITEGMKVKKGNGQSSLFQWLTNKDMNRHFDQEAQAIGSKFFIDEGGELYAVVGPQLKLTNPLMDRIIGRSQGKKQ